MSVLVLNYSELSLSIKNANKAANQARDYGDTIKKTICKKISSLPGGSTNNTSNADWFAQKKIAALAEKADRLDTFASKLGTFASNVEDTDTYVYHRFQSLSSEFKRQNDMKVNPVTEFFVTLVTGVVNASDFYRWVKDTYNKITDFHNSISDAIKYWYQCEGGKYVVEIGLSICAIALAIVVIATAGVGFLAIVAIIGASIAIINELVNISTATHAYIENESDPAWAKRYGDMDKASNLLNSFVTDNNTINKTLYFTGDLIDATKAVCDIVGILNLGNKIAQSSKHTTSLKNLFGSKDSGLGSKFLSDTKNIYTDKYVVSLKSFGNGCKTIATDTNFRHNLIIGFKSDVRFDAGTIKNSLTQLKTSGINGAVKQVFSSDTAKKSWGNAWKGYSSLSSKLDKIPESKTLKNGLKTMMLFDDIFNKKISGLKEGNYKAIVGNNLKMLMEMKDIGNKFETMGNVMIPEREEGNKYNINVINFSDITKNIRSLNYGY